MQVVQHIGRVLSDWEADEFQPQTALLYAQTQALRTDLSIASKVLRSLCMPFQQVCTANPTNSKVTDLSPGIKLPDDLVLVHEHNDHYSLQAAKEMSLQDASNRKTQRSTRLTER